jgi:predicted porin
MIKKILPTMIGVAMAGGMTAAAADVSVFGHIDTSIDYIDSGASIDNGFGTITDGKDTTLNCTTCSIGFKGSEDLGNGLKAIFSLDFQYDTTERNPQKHDGTHTTTVVTPGSSVISPTISGTLLTHNGAITDRDQWLGLSGGFGKVRIGTISTGYKSHGAMLDPLYRTSLQGRDHGLQSRLHSGAGEEGQGRATNTIRYDSPSFSGLNVVAHYTIDSDETDGEDDNPYGIGASYENGGILVFGDYLTNDGSHPATDLEAWKLGGKFSMSNFAVMGQYESLDDSNGGRADTTVWHVAGSYTMGSNLLYAAYGNEQRENAVGVETRDADAWTIAGIHSMSKNTSVYLGYNNVDNGGGPLPQIETDQFSLGMKHKF